jgi:DmsE family decaheme c-type cytochrome
MSYKSPFRLGVPILMTCALLGALFLRTGSASAQDAAGQGEAAKAAPRASTLCLDCHDGRDTTLVNSPHQLKKGAMDGPNAKIACTDCHGSDSRHWEDDAKKYPMVIPSKADAIAEAKICSACHQNSHQQNMAERNVHMRNDINCSSCHSVHESKREGLLKKPEVALCLGCHTDVQGQFAKPYRHPVEEGIVKCSDCHMTLDETRTELSQNGTNFCTKCHAEMQGPFPFEHVATLDFSTEEGGCLSCHEAHGSYLPRMLKQPLEPPRYALCTQCHAVPGHNLNVNHGTRWAGKACNDCHTDIHGSYSNRLLIRDDLEAQLGETCFNVGCHQLQ